MSARFEIPSNLPPAIQDRLKGRAEYLGALADTAKADKEWAEELNGAKSTCEYLDKRAIPTIYRNAARDKARDVAAFDDARRFEPDFKNGLILFGPSGSGKTCAAYYLLLEEIFDGFEVSHLPAVELSKMVRESTRNPQRFGMIMNHLTLGNFDEYEDFIESTRENVALSNRWYCPDGLLIDDIHVPKFTPAYAAALYSIVEAFSSQDKMLIVTCQMGSKGLLAKWKHDDPELADTATAICRRIMDHCRPVQFHWEDSPWE